jgi:membrane protein YqaA with SNARE-associated domain
MTTLMQWLPPMSRVVWILIGWFVIALAFSLLFGAVARAGRGHGDPDE